VRVVNPASEKSLKAQVFIAGQVLDLSCGPRPSRAPDTISYDILPEHGICQNKKKRKIISETQKVGDSENGFTIQVPKFATLSANHENFLKSSEFEDAIYILFGNVQGVRTGKHGD
jgi:hypothetical protein